MRVAAVVAAVLTLGKQVLRKSYLDRDRLGPRRLQVAVHPHAASLTPLQDVALRENLDPVFTHRKGQQLPVHVAELLERIGIRRRSDEENSANPWQCDLDRGAD